MYTLFDRLTVFHFLFSKAQPKNALATPPPKKWKRLPTFQSFDLMVILQL
jgi:hypothetical protein